MNTPYMHPQTKTSIDQFLSNPSHAVLLTGDYYSGKGHLAGHLAGQLLKGQNLHASLKHFEAADIGIDDIRGLISDLKYKLLGDESDRRVIVIEHIEKLSHEAQNSLLKLLEEPPERAIFICTTSEKSAVLPTVISRLTLIQIRHLSLEQAKSIFENASEPELVRAYHLSDGAAASLISFIDSDEQELSTAVDWAKGILKSTNYERLLKVDELSKNDISQLDTYLLALQKVLRASILHSKSLSQAEYKRRISQLQMATNSRELLGKNVSSKLVLTNLFIAI